MKSGISANDLLFKIRANGVYETEKLKRMTLEQNCQLTIIEPGDENIRHPIIIDGSVNLDALEFNSKDINSLKYLSEVLKKISEIYLGEYLSDRLYLYGHPN